MNIVDDASDKQQLPGILVGAKFPGVRRILFSIKFAIGLTSRFPDLLRIV